jgi:hypothetical protein
MRISACNDVKGIMLTPHQTKPSSIPTWIKTTKICPNVDCPEGFELIRADVACPEESELHGLELMKYMLFDTHSRKKGGNRPGAAGAVADDVGPLHAARLRESILQSLPGAGPGQVVDNHLHTPASLLNTPQTKFKSNSKL